MRNKRRITTLVLMLIVTMLFAQQAAGITDNSQDPVLSNNETYTTFGYDTRHNQANILLKHPSSTEKKTGPQRITVPSDEDIALRIEHVRDQMVAVSLEEAEESSSAVQTSKVQKPKPKPEPKKQTPNPAKQIQQVQERLASLGYNPGSADGVMGSRTKQAIRWFQQVAGLSVDGVAGAQTSQRLFASNAPLAPEKAPAPAPSYGSSVEAKIHAVFGSEGPKAVRVAKCESQLYARAYNGSDPHGGSFGLFQINGVHFRYSNSTFAGYSAEDMYNPDINIRVAYELWKYSGWGIWGCGHA